MTQKEFDKLSEDEVRMLNGYDSLDFVTEAWRDGYIYLKEKIRKLFVTKHNSEFLDEVEKLISDEISEFSEELDD